MVILVVRGAVVIVGLLSVLGGFAGIAVGSETTVAGLWGVGFGLAIIVFALFERGRYRSAASERETGPVGPGGGEIGGQPVEPRFRPTDEVFIDPVSGHRMRVLIDSRSGERRYVAEG